MRSKVFFFILRLIARSLAWRSIKGNIDTCSLVLKFATLDYRTHEILINAANLTTL